MYVDSHIRCVYNRLFIIPHSVINYTFVVVASERISCDITLLRATSSCVFIFILCVRFWKRLLQTSGHTYCITSVFLSYYIPSCWITYLLWHRIYVSFQAICYVCRRESFKHYIAHGVRRRWKLEYYAAFGADLSHHRRHRRQLLLLLTLLHVVPMRECNINF